MAFLPGTHRLPSGIPRPVIDDPAASPAVVKIVPRAGDAVLFNTHVMHMAMDNSSPKVRKSLIYAYSHFWVKNYANAVPSDLEKYATTPLRRQMFGIEEEGTAYFNHRYDGNLRPADRSNSFYSASRRLIGRIRRATSATRSK